MDSFVGISFHNWWRLLMENNFQIDPPYWAKAALITYLSIINSRINRREMQKYSELLEKIKIDPHPIFILGHWRSGTTLLHRLLTLNPLFAFPTVLDIYKPGSFLINRQKYEKRYKKMIAQTRPMDKVRVSYDSPAEEEFAVAVMSLRSSLFGWVFPRNEHHYVRYLTFQDVADKDVAIWKKKYIFFLKKIIYKNKKELLVLKSPTNTGRIHLLLEMFPRAKFVHIHRNPYDVFRSTQNLYRKTVLSSQLQRRNVDSIDRAILNQYKKVYDSFFQEWPLIPEHQKYEVAFEELEKAPQQVIADIYRYLDLPGYNLQKPILGNYLASINSYQKNSYSELSAVLKQQIANLWSRSFEVWSYSI